MATMIEKRKATDERIYNAAVIQFGTKGYANTTLSSIAKSAGITPGLIVQNFGSKEELYRKIALDIVGRIHERFKDSSKVWDIRCRNIVEWTIDVLEKYPNSINFLNFYVSLISSLDTPDDVLNELYHMYKMTDIDDIIREGQEKGEVIEGDTYAIHGLFWINLHSTLSQCYNNNLQIPRTEWFLEIITKR